ncbi:YggT family protein [Elioraea rosea]|uniref:YggT family protein n=1 Tax=Elioraea rosea TaxID=2492390 RepID=UPI0011860B55|nr:YggT family protein [Elioraea rosea]
MTSEPHFILSYLPFWVVTYGLAVLAWTSAGRFLLQVMVAPDSRNYIWRGFRFLTDWWLAAIRFVTPLYVLPFYLPLVAAFWAFLLRYIATLAMFAMGLAPRLSTMQGG